MSDSDTTFGVDIEFEARCVKCRSKRDISTDSKRTLHDSSSDELSVTSVHILVTPEPCRCGEDRVRVKLRFDFGF